MNTAQILAALAVETDPVKQRALTAQLQRAREAARRGPDDSGLVAQRMTPVFAHSHHTAETDWLGKVATSFDPADVHRRAVAQATQWFRGLDPIIVSVPGELRAQANSYVQAWAGAFGSEADIAAGSFMQRVSHLAGFKVVAEDDEPDDSGEDEDPEDDTSGDEDSGWKDLVDEGRYGSRTAEWQGESCPRCGGNNPSESSRCNHCGGVLPGAQYKKSAKDDGLIDWNAETKKHQMRDKPSDPEGQDEGYWSKKIRQSDAKTAGTISDPQHVWTLNPDDEDWIGNFTDDAIAENERFWSSDEGRNAQPYLPGYADSMLKMIQDEKARRMGARKTAYDQAQVARDGNAGWDTIEGARQAAQDDVAAGRPPRKGFMAFPGTYLDAYDEAAGQPYGTALQMLRTSRKTAADGDRPLYEIAAEIRRDWKNVYFGAVPYLDAMSQLDSIEDMYYADDAYGIVLYFLSNAQSWRGEVAKRVKAELKAMTKRKYGSHTAASYGDVAECKFCGLDIQFLDGWMDRGGNTLCPDTMGGPNGDARRDENGMLVPNPNAGKPHQPYAQAYGSRTAAGPGAPMTDGFYRTTGPDNDKLEWVEPQEISTTQLEKERLFPDGIPLRGDLTPEQEDWLKSRASRTAGYKVIEDPEADQWEPYLPFSVIDEETGEVVARRPDLASAQQDALDLQFMTQFTNGTPASKYIPNPRKSSFHTADQGFGPDSDSQSGQAESQLPWVDVNADETFDMGWTQDGGGEDPDGADEMAPEGEIGPFDAARHTAKKVYVFQPVGMDLFDRRPHQPKPGTRVVLTQPGLGAPRNGTMGHVYVEDAETGQFYGLVLKNSLQPEGKTSARRTAVSLTNVGFEGGIGSNTAHGYTADGRKVIFRLSDQDAKDLAYVMTSDMAINFSGVDVDEADIISTASRRTADQGFGPAADSQSGQAESALPDVTVADDDDTNLGWIEDGANEDLPYELSKDAAGYGRARDQVCPSCGSRDIYDAARLLGSDFSGQWFCDDCKETFAKTGSRKQARNVTHFDDGHSEWPCERCGATVSRYRGEADVECPQCGASYNAGGQRLRDNWRDNPSVWRDDISDMDGYEMEQSRYEGSLRIKAMDQSDYDGVVAHFMGEHVTIRGGFEDGLTGVVTGHRWRSDQSPYGGGPGSYPVFEVTLDGGGSIGGIAYTNLDLDEAVTASRKVAEGPMLECYRCGKKGGYDTFGIPTKCPDCGSMEVHLPEANDNWKKRSLRRQADEGFAGNEDGSKPAGAAPMVDDVEDEAMFEADEVKDFEGAEGAAANLPAAPPFTASRRSSINEDELGLW